MHICAACTRKPAEEEPTEMGWTVSLFFILAFFNHCLEEAAQMLL